MCCSQRVRVMLVHLETGPGPHISDERPLTFNVAIVMFALDGLCWDISFWQGGGVRWGVGAGGLAWCGSLRSGGAGGDQGAW